MSLPPVDDVALNAYVDGELPPGQAAALARRASRDPDLARRIAQLHSLKAAVADTVDAGVPGPDSLAERHAPLRTRSRMGRRGAAVAAGLVLGIAIGGAAILRPTPGAPDPVVAMHDAWTAGGVHSPAEAPVWLTSVIEATGLSLVHSAPLDADAPAAGMHYAFVGTNDCRLSLFEIPATDRGESALTLQVQSDLRMARWQTDGQVYLVVARRMDGARFATIAAALGEAAASRTAPDPERVALLNAARQRCLS